MRFLLAPLFCVLALPLLPLCIQAGSPSPLPITTRQQTVRPIALPYGAAPVSPREVALYREYGYSAWKTGPGEDQGRRFDLMPSGYTGSPNAARLLSFFSLSDIHITDKESPAQVPYFGWSANFGAATLGLYSQAYSPVVLATTQVLDATIRTVNALHEQTPFDFGIVLGDVANNSQYNELRWFIDIMDGAFITPSSGDHRGADTIGYQKPFQAAGLKRSIPWYQVIGNHDQFWMGVIYPNAKLTHAFVDSEVLNIGPSLFAPYNSDATGVYVGVIDGTTPLGEVIKGGPSSLFATPPTVVADQNRHTVMSEDSFTAGFVSEFSRSSSWPVGHGFTDSSSACYTFEPKSELPLKVIVLDNTCKSKGPSGSPSYFGNAWIDEERYAWLTNELQKGQDAGQLMILAAHIPISPQKDLSNTTRVPQFHASSYKNDAELIATLQRYPNLILLIAGHRHMNVVTPQPSPDPLHPENGFWEVETPSLRDFPRQFRTFDIRRNRDNTISILATAVDPQTEAGSPASDSLDYAIGAYRIFGNGMLTDESSHAYNVELVKVLTPEMQARIAALGEAIPTNAPPAILVQPSNAAAKLGSSATFSVTATSPLGLDYQWQKSVDGITWTNLSDDSRHSGSRSSALTVLKIDSSAIGQQFRCVINDGVTPTVSSKTASLSLSSSQFSALSARAYSGLGDQSLILGFAVTGEGKPALLRCLGPSLLRVDAGLAGQVLADPRLQLYERNGSEWVPTATNDNWSGSSELRTLFARLGAFPLEDGSKDAAVSVAQTSSLNTAIISGVGTTEGVVLAEVYDADPTDKSKRLNALSARSQVGFGGEILIAGFVIEGDASKKVIVRGIGPGLSASIAGFLADPKIQLWKLNSATGTWAMVGENDDWGGRTTLATAFAAIGMSALKSDSRDAVLQVELQPGIYTALLSGVNNSTGVALLEVYEVP